MNRYLYILLFFFTVTAQHASAQLLRGRDVCYDKDIKSIQLHKLNGELTDPVIELSSDEKLLLTFDDLSNSGRYLIYRITLCDADWSESNLPVSDYISGFPEDNIDQFSSSFNTYVDYLNYSLTLPNERMGFIRPGSYLLKVFATDNPDSLLFQKSFSVVETSPQLFVQSQVRAVPLAGNPDCSQQLEFSLSHSKMIIQNPHTEVKVRIGQNGHRVPQTPTPSVSFIRNEVIDYSMYNKNVYMGNAEFRSFDITSLEYRSLNVRKIEVVDDVPHVLLDEDTPNRQYTSQKDLNGRYVIRNQRYTDNSNTESEYAQVHFRLRVNAPYKGNLYLFGELTNWELTNRYVMLYNSRWQCYELTLPFKQGYYSYRYVLVNEKGEVDFGIVDGCSNEAENVYGIYVYHHGLADRSDKLINVTFIKSQGSIGK
ncbi:MAG: DUF5103 domain-containing protein [Prevotellaceae bacterium]|jgi:hypothetical protein|nr:DUF5103 domain-containing protein [Prevotellaceae bacterium]